MLSPGDKIIINDNKASLTVEKIVEDQRSKARTITGFDCKSQSYNENEIKKIHKLNTRINMRNNKTKDDNYLNFDNNNFLTCQSCKEINDYASKKHNEKFKFDERINFPRIRTTIEPDIHLLLDKIENNENQRIQEIKDLKMMEFEQDQLFGIDTDEMKNIETKKIDGFIQFVAELSEQKYTEKISRDDYEYQIDISSIKSTENNLSNSNNNSNCLNCNFDNIQNPTIASIKLKDKIRNRGISNNKMRKIEIVKRFEIICTVDYDCRITDNSFLYIPGNRLTK